MSRFSVSIALAAFGCAGPALAEPIAVDSLPAVKLAPPASTKTAPAHIPAGEKLDGFAVSAPTPAEVRAMELSYGGPRRITIAATKTEPGTREAHRPGDARRGGPCFSTSDSPSGTAIASINTSYVEAKPAPGSPTAKWFATRSPEERAWEKRFHDQLNQRWKQHPVASVRSTRLIDGADPRLEVVDAWVDTETLGVRLAAKTSIPLKQVAQVFGGAVYAARDGNKISFAIVPAPLPADAPNLSFRGVEVELPSRALATNACGPARIDLDAAPGSGVMGTALFDAYLPPKPDPDATPDELRRQHLVRVRPIAVHLSVSQLASESAPIATVSFDWAGAGVQQFFTPVAQDMGPGVLDRAF